MVKFSKWISLFAFVALLGACFMDWAYYADIDRHFTGFYSEKNVYGRPAFMLLTLAGITSISSFFKVVFLKRVALITGGLNVAYAIKNFLLYGSCYRGYCPEKEIGLFIMLIASVLIYIMAFLPEGKPKREKQS